MQHREHRIGAAAGGRNEGGASARLATGHGLVLLVEDEEDIRTTLGEALEDSGYGVASAADGEEALGLLARGLEPDMVVLDLMMPRMDGWLFLERFRSDPHHAQRPVLVISAAPDDRPCAANAWLPKPFHIDEFDRIVARLCGH